MQRDFSRTFTGFAFLAAAVMLWAGWMLLPHHLGTYFKAEDFAAVRAQFHLWIWMYRVHMFGIITTAVAVVALASQLVRSPARVLVWPGTAVATAGLIVGAVGSAFYYHNGAWGAVSLADQPAAAAQQLVDSLLVLTEYVTCLVRFGRVFSGLGLVLLGWGLWQGKILPVWLSGAAILLGLAAMALTMALPDHLHLYAPIFHLSSLWLAAMGGVILCCGLSGTE